MRRILKIGKSKIGRGGLSLRMVGEGSSERAQVERFAHRIYEKQYGADLRVFSSEILVMESRGGEVLSCVGINNPGSGRLFTEQYLDRPVEEEISARTGSAVMRDEVVEVGTMAVHPRGLCQLMMAGLTGVVTGRARRYIVFTAVQSLQNTLRRLGLSFTVLAEANPKKLSGGLELWGRYYDASPRVIVLDLEECWDRVRVILNNNDGAAFADRAVVMASLFIEGLHLERAACGGSVA